MPRRLTFFAESRLARRCLCPLFTAARERGHEVRWAERSDEAADVGIYSLPSHRLSEVMATFAVVVPPGPGYAAGTWPHFWRQENWDRFDLGLLPSRRWLSMWRAHLRAGGRGAPRYGVRLAGWAPPPRDGRPRARPRLVVAVAEEPERTDQLLREWTAGLSVEIVRLPEDVSPAAHVLAGRGPTGGGPRLSGPHQPADDTIGPSDLVVTDDPSLLIETMASGGRAVGLSPLTGDPHLWPGLGPLRGLVVPLDARTLQRWVASGDTAGGAGIRARPLPGDLRPTPDAARRSLQWIEEALDPVDRVPSPRAAMRAVPTLVHRLGASEALCQQLLATMPPARLAALNIRFDEAAYRRRHPDIDRAMAAGVLSDGLLHWQGMGHREGRAGPFHIDPPAAAEAPVVDNYHDMLARRSAIGHAPKTSGGGADVVVLWSPAYDRTSGGTISLHKLGAMLRRRGVDARMWWPQRDADAVDQSPWGLPSARPMRGREKFVAIYPEIVDGNPLGATHVVRWLLNYPGVLGANAGFEATDLVLHIGPFAAQDPDPALELCVIHDADQDEADGGRLGQPTPGGAGQKRDIEGCFVLRKGRSRPRVPVTEGLINIDGMSRRQTNEIFARARYFYSYDKYTFLLLQAAMRGATAVVVPDPAMTAVRWRKIFPLANMGVAYGNEEEDWAKGTRALIPAHLDHLAEKSEIQVDALLGRLRQANWWSGARVSIHADGESQVS